MRLKGPTPRTRYVEDVELNAFLEKCGNDFIRAYVDLKMLTGLRQGQLLSLRREWWDSKQLIVPPAKGGRATAYADNPQGELANAIQALAGVHGPNAVRSTEFIVTTRRGKPYTTDGFRAIWSRAMKKYLDATGNERFTENDLRAKVATDAESLLHAQERLGHTSSKTTLTHYTRKARPVLIHGRGNWESD